MAEVGIKELLEAGVHFGHQTRRWNPKMRRFIHGERAGIYIIDLLKTQALLEQAQRFATEIAHRGGTVLFVGTKKQARDGIRDIATAAGQPYVNHRWLGGLLTNYQTMSARIKRLHDLERYAAEGQLALLPTRERLSAEADLLKLQANLGGVKNMQRVPDAMFVIDLKTEAIAVREAQRLRIPIIGLVDTNCDPDGIDYVIPGNDDAIRACTLITHAIGDVVQQGRSRFRAEEEAARAEAAAQAQREAEERARREEEERAAAEAAERAAAEEALTQAGEGEPRDVAEAQVAEAVEQAVRSAEGTADAEAAAAATAATEPAAPAAGSPGPSHAEQVESPDAVEHEKAPASPPAEEAAPEAAPRQKARKAKAKAKPAAPEPGPSEVAEEAAGRRARRRRGEGRGPSSRPPRGRRSAADAPPPTLRPPTPAPDDDKGVVDDRRRHRAERRRDRGRDGRGRRRGRRQARARPAQGRRQGRRERRRRRGRRGRRRQGQRREEGRREVTTPTISAKQVAELRKLTGAGMMECKNALTETNGDIDAAVELLRVRLGDKALKIGGREATEGTVASYIHSNGKVGVLVEVDCNTDFVARNEDFIAFAREVAMHIAASPATLYVSEDDIPQDAKDAELRVFEQQAADKPEHIRPKIAEGKLKAWMNDVVLLNQVHVNADKYEGKTIEELRANLSGKTGENVVIRRFARFAVGA